MPELFVYGTLKRGGRLHHHMEARGCKYLRDIELEGFKMYDFGWYPGIIPGDGAVKGEVFDITEEMLVHLDEVEGVPNWFRRERVNGMWVYLFNADIKDAKSIDDGLWREPDGPATGKP